LEPLDQSSDLVKVCFSPVQCFFFGLESMEVVDLRRDGGVSEGLQGRCNDWVKGEVIDQDSQRITWVRRWWSINGDHKEGSGKDRLVRPSGGKDVGLIVY
jgi:hypothetical protein